MDSAIYTCRARTAIKLAARFASGRRGSPAETVAGTCPSSPSLPTSCPTCRTGASRQASTTTSPSPSTSSISAPPCRSTFDQSTRPGAGERGWFGRCRSTSPVRHAHVSWAPAAVFRSTPSDTQCLLSYSSNRTRLGCIIMALELNSNNIDVLYRGQGAGGRRGGKHISAAKLLGLATRERKSSIKLYDDQGGKHGQAWDTGPAFCGHCAFLLLACSGIVSAISLLFIPTR